MQGTIEQANTEYWWWAGPANDGAHEGFCVHCRDEKLGVTQYLDSEPTEDEARKIAESLIPKVQSL